MKNKRINHLKSSLAVLEKALEIMVAEVEEMKPTVDINNIGKFVKKEIEVIELKEKIAKIKEELN